MTSNPVIVVDDEPDALLAVETMLESAGCENIVTCSDAAAMWRVVESRRAELIILDIIMPGASGEETLTRLGQDFPDIPVIMATGINELDTAVRCMRNGAHDYLLKPMEGARLIAAVRHALEIRDLRRSYSALTDSLFRATLRCPEAFSAMTTIDPKMTAIFKYIEAVGPSSHPILLTGETGVGKELAAHAIHAVSRRSGEFVAINVAGLDDTMFADTLFGHSKGAFTGAETVRKGLVEKAADGTLFLDEIGELGVASQVKLLRLLQEREFYPIGSDIAKRSDARIVAVTARPIAELHNGGMFRRDLYYRLKTHHIHIPPLRERKGDIPPLVQEFFRCAAVEYGNPIPALPKELYALLDTWHFPGNVRELRAMVFDAMAAYSGKALSLRSFKEAIGLTKENNESSALVAEIEPLVMYRGRLPTFKESEALLLHEAMKRAGGNKTLAAGLLGVTRQAISQRLKNKRKG